jgi:hypothetical protein
MFSAYHTTYKHFHSLSLQEMGKIAHTYKVTDQYTLDIESFPGYVSARIVQP